MPLALYDAIADWYAEWVTEGAGSAYARRVTETLSRLLPAAPAVDNCCLDVCCGTGAHGRTLRSLGWNPVGVDLSPGQLRHGRTVMPVAVGDATALPIRSNALPAAVCVLAHSDLPDYPAVLREIARVLRPGGHFVHIGIHPCFTGAFSDRSDPGRIIIDDSYDRTERRFESFTTQGVRNRIGAWHVPMAAMLNAVIGAGLHLVETVEVGGENQVPDAFALAAVKPRSQR